MDFKKIQKSSIRRILEREIHEDLKYSLKKEGIKEEIKSKQLKNKGSIKKSSSTVNQSITPYKYIDFVTYYQYPDEGEREYKRFFLFFMISFGIFVIIFTSKFLKALPFVFTIFIFLAFFVFSWVLYIPIQRITIYNVIKGFILQVFVVPTLMTVIFAIFFQFLYNFLDFRILRKTKGGGKYEPGKENKR